MTEDDFDKFLELFTAGSDDVKLLRLSEKIAERVRAGEDVGSEHFHFVETEPNYFQLVKRDE